jgi:hypothetical protein
MIIHALASACIAFYLIKVVRWDKRIAILARKPFSCTVCLSAWVGLILGLLNSFEWQAIEVMFIAGVMGLILENGANRWL